MSMFRGALSFAIVVGSLTLVGCEQGNEPGGPPPVIPPDAPKTSADALNLGKGAPDPTKRSNMPPPPPPATK